MNRDNNLKIESHFEALSSVLVNANSLVKPVLAYGRVLRILGGVVKAEVPNGKLGEMCRIVNIDGSEVGSEIIGFEENGALLTPFGSLAGVGSSSNVIATGQRHMIGVGSQLLGKVLDGMGNVYSGFSPIASDAYYPVSGIPPDPMSRNKITKPLCFGIRALDALLSCGEGQRMGIFAAAGVGKSTLLGMIVRQAVADVIVVGLIGERGREVREFIEDEIGPEGMKRSVIIVATSDRPAVERAKAAHVATAIAEYFRDTGQRVLLLMDSITRFARAQREIGLAAGEVPTRRGFPSSVFAELPRLLERAGNSDKGSITALYTVLVEGDDFSEPVADETRSILDGHIILSRKLAEKNHFPAIDVQSSISRVMTKIVSVEHIQSASKVRELMSAYDEIELLVRVGEYKHGQDPVADEAIEKIGSIHSFLKQSTTETSCFDVTVDDLNRLVGGDGT